MARKKQLFKTWKMQGALRKPLSVVLPVWTVVKKQSFDIVNGIEMEETVQ